MHGSSKNPVANGVWWIKALGGVLATETVLLRRGHNTDTQGAVGSIDTCKLCEETEETNCHMLGECTAEPTVVAARRRLIADIKAITIKFLGDSATAKVVQEL